MEPLGSYESFGVLQIIHGSHFSLPALEQTQCKQSHEIEGHNRRRGWGVFITGLSGWPGLTVREDRSTLSGATSSP